MRGHYHDLVVDTAGEHRTGVEPHDPGIGLAGRRDREIHGAALRGPALPNLEVDGGDRSLGGGLAEDGVDLAPVLYGLISTTVQ